MDSSIQTQDILSVAVCCNIARAAAALRKDIDIVLGPAGLSGPQFGILLHLETAGSMPLNELGKRLWVTCGNVTGLVDKLVAAGYVRRTRLRNDRRVILAELTDIGREVVANLRPIHRKRLAHFTSGLSELELRELQLLLEKICITTQAGGE